MSKRKLLKLVESEVVSGWDDPRMPTISGLRRRGYTPRAINKFIETIGVAKRDNIIDVALLEFCVREDLNKKASRVMGVIKPLKLVIINYNEDQEEWLKAENNPEDEKAGFRKIPFSKYLYIEKNDFKENAGDNYFRLTLGKEVRLKNAYIIKGEKVVKDSNGEILEIHCSYNTKSLSGTGTKESLKKVKGTLHWVSCKHALQVEVREYDRLFTDEAPDNYKDKDFTEFINTNSLKINHAAVEPSLKNAKIGDHYQFQRLGYFNVDHDSTPTKLIFNKTVGLRDTWAKVKEKNKVNINVKKDTLAIDRIKQFGKKYIKLTEEKQLETRIEIQKIAKNVSYEELKPLFNTAIKKSGTRIITMITLGILLKEGLTKNKDINAFIDKALDDKNKILVHEARLLL